MATTNIFRCFICNVHDIPFRDGIAVFDNNVTLGSGLTLCETVTQILGREIDPLTVCPSPIICKKCYKTCQEYDDINKRLSNLKNQIADKMRHSLPAFMDESKDSLQAQIKDERNGNKQIIKNIKAIPTETIKSISNAKFTTPLKTISPKTITLPKSKLKPLPSGFDATALKNNIQAQILTSPNKVIKGTSLSQFIKLAPPVKRSSGVGNLPAGDYVILDTTSTNAIVPRMTPHSSSMNKTTILKNEVVRPHQVKVEASPNILEAIAGTSKQADGEDDYVISQLEILEDDECEDGETDTILMDENGSILQVLRGDQRELLSHVKQIALVMPKEENKEMVMDTDAANNEDKEIKIIKKEDEESSQDEAVLYNRVISDPGARLYVERVNFQYTCLLCVNSKTDDDQTVTSEEVFTRPEDLMTHARTEHKLRLYVCTECGDVFSKHANYNAHMSVHRRDQPQSKKRNVDRWKPHECRICKNKYTSQNLLEEHMNKHTGVRPYQCQVCEKTFSNKYSYNAHVKIHTDRPRPFDCSMCDKSFLTLANKISHEKTHDGDKQYSCDHCDKKFATQHNLTTHLIIHSGAKPYVCGICERAFARRNEIRDHLRIHTGERPFACDICGKKFAQKSNLLSHRRTTHFDDRRYPCDQCDKKFKRKRLLDYHARSVHTGERPHKCHLCQATFVYPEHYKKHLALHTGVKPFACEICNRTFNSRDNRNAHRFTHSEKKPFECLVCGAGFMRKPILYAHMTAKNHLADMIVVNQAQISAKEPVNDLRKAEESISEANKLGVASDLGSLVDILEDKPYEQSGGEAAEASADDNSDQAGVEQGLLALAESNEDTSVAGQLLTSDDLGQLLSQGSEVLTTDEDGNIMRLVQIQLADGKTEWVAIDS